MTVGVTGGIGSGKTAVCELFAELGIPVYNCDERSRALLDNSVEIRAKVVDLLGAEAYAGGAADREFISRKVFNNKQLLGSLQAILHPAVGRDFEIWMAAQTTVPYVVMESAILFESGFDKLLDTVINVAAPEKLRLERVAKRAGMSPEQIRERMKNQLTESERTARTDRTIENIGTLNELKIKVLQLDKELRK